MKFRKHILLFLLLSWFIVGCSSVPLAGYAEYRKDPDNWENLDDYDKIVDNGEIIEDETEEKPLENVSLPDMQVHFLDVGQGNATLFVAEDAALLIDGGDRDTSSYVVSYLQNTASVTYLDAMVATHYDADHISGLIGVLASYKGYIGAVFDADYVSDTKTYESFISKREVCGAEHIVPALNDIYKVGEHIYLQFLGPVEYTDTDNDNSLIIKVIYGNTSFLIPGDAELGSLERVSYLQGDELSSDVLLLSHHGSYTGGYEPFLSYVAPKAAVLQCGFENEYGHPHKKQMDFLKENDIPLYRTDIQGEIIVNTDGNSITWSLLPSEDYRTGEELNP